MGPVMRIAGTWAVTTALIVAGVDAAIERVASDVSVARPAPMTPADVDSQLRTRQRGATSTTTLVVDPAAPATTPPPTVAPPPTLPPSPPPAPPPATHPAPPTSSPRGPEATRTTTHDGEPSDATTPARGGSDDPESSVGVPRP